MLLSNDTLELLRKRDCAFETGRFYEYPKIQTEQKEKKRIKDPERDFHRGKCYVDSEAHACALNRTGSVACKILHPAIIGYHFPGNYLFIALLDHRTIALSIY